MMKDLSVSEKRRVRTTASFGGPVQFESTSLLTMDVNDKPIKRSHGNIVT